MTYPFRFRIRKLVRALARLSRARGGNVAVTFAIALIPILAFVGAAVDFSRGNAVKASLQAALDSTALMISKNAASATGDQLQASAQSYFLANFTRPEAKNIKVTATYSNSGGSSVVVNGSADMDTSFVGVIGYKTITVTGTSTAKWGSNRLRVALVLDTTGSMAQDGKMPALKSATKGLLAQLQAAAGTDGDVYVSIIPFSKDVNVGSSNYTATWIDWTDWNAKNGSCNDNDYSTQSSCTSHGKTWTPANHNTWNGCITDRGNSSSPSSANYDQNVTAPTTGVTASLYPAEQYNNCPLAMMGLNYNWTAMNSLVDQMYPAGNTNQPIGLVWGWLSLVGGGPLTAPAKDSNYQYQDVIILMSDGLNTADRWYTSQSSVDKRMYDSSNNGTGTCANIKATSVTIYTIHVNTGGDPMSTLLQNCASDTNKFWQVTSSSGLGTVFSAIGTNLTQLRVAK
jgi:Flp pilus assembly protein TadG